MSGRPEGQPPANPENWSRGGVWRGRLRAISLLLVLLLVTVGIFIVPALMSNYDETHRAQIECTVTDAEGGVASASARGAASWSRVLINTSDCGTLTLTTGITESNRDAVAGKLSQGKFSFEVGASTKATWKVYDLFGLWPEVYSFQEID